MDSVVVVINVGDLVGGAVIFVVVVDQISDPLGIARTSGLKIEM